MPDIDYDPVTTPEEEEERKRRDGDYPPVPPASVPQPYGPPAPESAIPPVAVPSVNPSAPPVSMKNSPTFKSMGAMEPVQPLVKDAPRPQWKDYAPPEPHGWAKFGHAMAALNPATNAVFNVQPQQRAAAAYKNATSEYEAPFKEDQETAATGEANAKADEEKAHADSLRNPQPKEGVTPEEKFMMDALHGNNGQPKLDPQGKPYTYLTAHGAWKQAEQDTKPDKGKQTREITRVVNGVPHTVMVDSQTGEDVKDEGQTKIPGESPEQRRSATESVAVEREARAHVAKAEQDYNNARSTVAMQRELIKEAKSGNKEAVRMVPLEGALEITTSQGVHRINRTEVEQYGSAGNLFDKIKARIGSGVSGKSIPDDVLKDMDAMTSELQKNAHDRYKREYEYNKSVVEGYGGKGFDKRVPMVQPEPEAQPFKAPDGAPAAPKEDGHKLKANGQVIAISQGGQWVAPQ